MSTKTLKSSKSKSTSQTVRERLTTAKPLALLFSGLMTGLALLGGLVAALSFLPRVSVSPSDPVDPHNTLSSSFTIQNNNFVPLRHVYAMVAVGEIMRPGEPFAHPDTKWSYESTVAHPSWIDHDLGMDKKFTITPDQIFHAEESGGAGDADIAIVVRYHAWIFPWTSETTFRFRTYKQTNGNYTWLSQP